MGLPIAEQPNMAVRERRRRTQTPDPIRCPMHFNQYSTAWCLAARRQRGGLLLCYGGGNGVMYEGSKTSHRNNGVVKTCVCLLERAGTRAPKRGKSTIHNGGAYLRPRDLGKRSRTSVNASTQREPAEARLFCPLYLVQCERRHQTCARGI